LLRLPHEISPLQKRGDESTRDDGEVHGRVYARDDECGRVYARDDVFPDALSLKHRLYVYALIVVSPFIAYM